MRKNTVDDHIDSLSLFFPAYNEEDNIKETVEKAVSVLKEITSEWEVLVINDGSKDQTGEIVKQLEKKNKRIRLVNHAVNKGYGEALKTGFKNARYPWVAFADSDGQFDFSEIKKFLPHTEDSDFILGFRLNRADSYIRKLLTWGWKTLALLLLGLRVKDYSCGFKLIRKEAYDKTLPLTAGEKVTQIEFLVKASRLGMKFKEVGVHHYPRRFGTQTGANIKVFLKSVVDLFKLWWKLLDKKSFFVVLIILFIATFLRLYRIDEYLTFLGDEGRDAVLVRRLLVNFDPILIGPGTSIGNMYLGPLYYYMMAPAMFFAGLSPVGPAVQIAILGVITVWLVYKVGKEWFGTIAGITASALYAVSPVIITYSRSSWNPNIMPFFALLSIYSIWRVWRHNESKWLLVLGTSFAFVLQSHYLGLLLLPTLGLFWMMILIRLWKSQARKSFLIHTSCSIILFCFLMSPLVIFDARHGWRNFEAMKVFFTNRQETVSFKPWNALPELWPTWHDKFVTRVMAGMETTVSLILSIFLVTGLIFLVFKNRNKLFKSPLLLLCAWLFVGLFGLGIYKQNVYDHYFGFMFAAPFLLLGAVIGQVTGSRPSALRTSTVSAQPNPLRLEESQVAGYRGIVSEILLVGLLVLVGLNIYNTPIKNQPNRQLQRTEEVARKIAQEAQDRPFNLAVLAERNYEDAYQYFLEWWKEPVRDIDPLRYEETVAEQLFVVCELAVDKCDPVHNPKAEITVFGWSKIDQEWDVSGTKLYKLVHNPSGQ